jgi:Asp-tRNA(Asn)/Glu-tRNA(Gln) amidotransferase B subunit
MASWQVRSQELAYIYINSSCIGQRHEHVGYCRATASPFAYEGVVEGSLRVDANVSLCHSVTGQVTPRCEVKNVNGLRFLTKAIGMRTCFWGMGRTFISANCSEYEAQRHRDAIAQDTPLTMETRYYDVPSK